jgi:hypothetical protein
MKFDLSGRSDYAACGGDQFTIEFPISNSGGTPPSWAAAIDDYHWPDTSKLTGVVLIHEAVNINDVTDGTSYTYALGEKHLAQDAYENAICGGDRESLYVGWGNDVIRTAYYEPLRDVRHADLTYDRREQWRFGSAHPSVFHMGLCDGSVQAISYEIDPPVHKNLGNRADGNKVDNGSFAP